MGNISKINIYIGEVGQAYVNKIDAKNNLDAANKNVDDVNAIITTCEQYLESANEILNNANDAKVRASQIRADLESKIVAYQNDPIIKGKLVELLNKLDANDTDNNYKNGGGEQTATNNSNNIQNLINDLNDIKSTAMTLNETNTSYAEECNEAYQTATEVFESYLVEYENNDTPNNSDTIEEELIERLDNINDGLEAAQETTDNVNQTSDEVQNEANEIIQGGGSEPEPVEPETTYYWYAGTTPVDGNNYTSISSQVTTIPTTTTITLNNEYLYIVVPESKTVTVVDKDGYGTALKTYDSTTGTFTNAFTTVNGYAIYKSVAEDTNVETITIS